MLFSHISDTHLGLSQYGTSDRENDVYDAFNQAIDISIRDHVNFVIFSGDIFDTPTPSGTAIVVMANALKRLKEAQINSFFILGEHDISRVQNTPIPYVYHNLDFSRYIGDGRPIIHQGIMLCGFDKMRKSEIPAYSARFAEADQAAKNHDSTHKIFVLHQGIAEFHKFAAELPSSDLPPHFTYYAMGHLHTHGIQNFNHLGGPVVYPGSIESTTGEGIRNNVKKGFVQVDLSGADAKPTWIKLDTRPHFSYEFDYDSLESMISDTIIPQLESCISSNNNNNDGKTRDNNNHNTPHKNKKPVVGLRIKGDKVETEKIHAQITRLYDLSLTCPWKIISPEESPHSILINRPSKIDEEMFRLSTKFTGSEDTAKFAVHELLPLLYSNQIKDATDLIIKHFEEYKKEAST